MFLEVPEFCGMACDQESMTTLRTPLTDIAALTDQLGHAWGVSCGESIAQYLAWCDRAGVFSFMAQHQATTLVYITENTLLNERGADALLCLLASLNLVHRWPDGMCTLSTLAKEYLLKDSPFYVGAGLYVDCEKELPQAYVKSPLSGATMPAGIHASWPVQKRLKIQHSRNFAPSVAAARTGQFDDIHHLIDIAGGSGVFAIPLALDRPDIHITLVEVPDAIDDIRDTLAEYGLQRRITLVPMDVFREAWNFDTFDGMFFGNFFHFISDDECRFLCRKSFETLPANGRVWLHEVLFNELRDGPLLAALWNLNMIVRKEGARQRTASELFDFLQTAGFQKWSATTTVGRFSLLSAVKSDSGTP
jgi:hypothetical protein